MSDTNVPQRVVLVDGSAFIFRAYHALPPLSRPDGTPVGAVMGFCNMLYRLLEDAHATVGVPTHMAVIFDAAKDTFRNEIYADYKANRPPPPEDLIPQFDLIRDATRAFNVPSIELLGYEADDLIATYAAQARAMGAEVAIVSSDKDLMQLVDDAAGIFMWDPMKNRRLGAAEVVEKFGVGPDKVVDVQSLCGDSTDNVPGVPGIGVKTAAQLIQAYGSLDDLLVRAEEIKQPKRRQNLIENAELARISRDLVRLRDDVPDVPALAELKVIERDYDKLVAFLTAQSFRSLVAKIGPRAGGGPAPASASSGTASPAVSAAGRADPAVVAAQAMAALDKGTYTLVDDMAEVRRWVAEAMAAGHVTVDTETTGLDPTDADLVGVSLCIEPGTACYIPVGHTMPEGDLTAEVPKQLDREDVLAALRPLFADPAVLKIGQNLKYDIAVLAKYGVAVAPIEDTMLLSFALDAGRGGHGMDELSQRHLGLQPIPFKEVAGTGKNQITFDKVPLDRARDYAAEDADLTARLHRVLRPRLAMEKVVRVYETLERPLAPVLAAMETAGIKVDTGALARLSNDFATRAAALEAEIHALAGRPFTVGSPKQLGEVLFDDLKLSGGKKGKSGAYKTDHEVLERLAADHPLPAKVLEWRQLTKLKSTYTDALQAQVSPRTGRVHTSYSMVGAQTGRLSSNDPNLQNIPIRTEEGRKIRHAFIAEPGHVLMSADYSQIELRLLAHIAGIEALKQAFHDGLDIHALTASQVFGVPIEGMDPLVRRNAKAINFGIVYGISAFGLGNQLSIPTKAAQAYIDAYFAKYPGIADYMDKTKRRCRDRGYVETIFGRRIHIDAIKDRNPARRGFGERAAINAPIQGSAADVIKRAMIRMPAALAAAGLSAKMLLQVHDELVFEVPTAEVERTAETVRATMQGAAHLSVPLDVDVGTGANWQEAH